MHICYSVIQNGKILLLKSYQNMFWWKIFEVNLKIENLGKSIFSVEIKLMNSLFALTLYSNLQKKSIEVVTSKRASNSQIKF